MLKLRNIMTQHVHTMSPDFSIRDAMEFLAARRVSGAPVVEHGQVIGVISASDLIAFAAALPEVRRAQPADDDWPDEEAMTDPDDEEDDDDESTYFRDMLADASDDVDVRFREAERVEPSQLDGVTVAEVMTATVHSLPSTTDVSRAADYMRRAGIHRVLVMDDGKLSGIVSATDIAGAVADHRVEKRTYIFNHEL